MGHDICAKRPGVDAEALREKYGLNDNPGSDDWMTNFEAYQAETEVAYNRRSAGNPLNQVLYLALGVMDEAYGGCSGRGVEIDVTLEQFKAGLAALEGKSFAGMTQERNLLDDVCDVLKRAGAEIATAAPNDLIGVEVDVSQERKFIENCIAYCEAHQLDELEVFFG